MSQYITIRSVEELEEILGVKKGHCASSYSLAFVTPMWEFAGKELIAESPDEDGDFWAGGWLWRSEWVYTPEEFSVLAELDEMLAYFLENKK